MGIYIATATTASIIVCSTCDFSYNLVYSMYDHFEVLVEIDI